MNCVITHIIDRPSLSHCSRNRSCRGSGSLTLRRLVGSVPLLYRVGQLVLDGSIDNRELRRGIFQRISPLELAAAVKVSHVL